MENEIQKGSWKKIFASREIILILVLLIGGIIVSIITPVFATSTNILAMIMSITVNGLIAVGMVMLLAAGEMDLSVGMTMAYVGVVAAYLNAHGDTYIGTSQYDLGYEGAKKYAEMLGGKGKVAILTITGSDMFESRRKGFEDGFAEYPDITVVGVGDTKADSTTAVSAAKDLAVKNPDLNGFVCCDSTGAAGASTALSELGETGKVDVLGLDRNTDVLQMIQDGTITGSFAQNDISMSYWALVTLITEAHYDMPLTSDNKAAGVSVSPSYIYTSVNLITKDNVEYFLKENEVYATNNF